MDCDMKAALYIRVSTEEQAAEGQSIAAQIDVLTQYCKAFNIEVYDIYKDLGISGKDAYNRPGLQQMLLDAKKGCFNMVLVWKISRLSRSLKDLLMILEELEQANVVFSSYSEKFDTSSAVGKMTLQLLGTIAEFERNTIVDNVKLGLQEYAKQGGKTGTVLGYDNIGKQLVVNEKEAEAVRLIYKLYTQDGLSMSAIAAHLNEAGFRTKRGNPFRKDSVAVILGNPVYVGYNRHRIGQKDQSITRGFHPHIIDSAEWEKAKVLRESNKHKRTPKTTASFVLSGKIKCPECCTKMSGFSSPAGSFNYRYYRCRKCGFLCQAGLIEAVVFRKLEALMLSERIFADIAALILKKESDITIKKSNQISKKELDKTLKLLDKYVLLLDQKDLADSSVIINKIKELESKISQMQGDITNHPIDLTNQPCILKSRALYDECIKSIFGSQNFEVLRPLIETAVECVVISKNKTLDKILLSFGELV